MLLAVLALCVPLAPTVQAANYYVDNAVAASGNGTSWASAWQSFRHVAWAALRPGDTLYVSGGGAAQTYTETLTVGASGTAGSPLTITAGTEPGHNGTVVIDGQLSRGSGISLDGTQYVIVRGFHVKNHIGEQGQIRVFNGTGNLVEANHLYVTGHGGVFVQNCTNTVIRGNTITTPAYSTAQTDGIYSQRNRGGNVYEYNTIVISNGEPNGHDDCIQLYQDAHTTLRGNYCEQDNGKTYNAQGFWMTDNTGTIAVYNNVLYGPHTGNTLIGLSNTSSGSAALVAYNNTVVGSAWGSIWLQNAPNSVIKNNVVRSDASNATLLRVKGPTPPAANINHNLYYAANSQRLFWNETANTAYTWAAWRNQGYDTNGQNADPKLVNIGSKNFSLASTSPGIDAGMTLPEVPADHDGFARPQGRAYDMGAYEFFGSSPSGTASPTLSASPGFVTRGQQVTVTWSISPGASTNDRDWVGLYLVGAPDRNYLAWTYTHASLHGSFTVPPGAAGTYEFRYLVNDGYTSTGRSNTVTVTAPPQ